MTRVADASFVWVTYEISAQGHGREEAAEFEVYPFPPLSSHILLAWLLALMTFFLGSIKPAPTLSQSTGRGLRQDKLRLPFKLA
jgi:hypothetical protein